MCHSAARARTVRIARRMSSAVLSMVYFEPGSRNSRYLSAKAVTPRLARYCAGSTPSGLNTSSRCPPPAATMTAVPLALPGAGSNTVSDGLWMFLYHQSWCCSGSSRRDSNPGAPWSQSGTTCGACDCCAGTLDEFASTTSVMAAKVNACLGMVAHLATWIRARGALFRRELVSRGAGLGATIHRRGAQSVRCVEHAVDVGSDI